MLHIHYTNNNRDKNLFTDDAFIMHINNIYSEGSLMDSYADQMKCYYFGPPHYGKNWDALYDCLGDFSWIPQDHIVIIHTSLANLDLREKNIYIKIVYDAVELQVNWIKKGNKVKIIDFVFEESDKDYIEECIAQYKVLKKNE